MVVFLSSVAGVSSEKNCAVRIWILLTGKRLSLQADRMSKSKLFIDDTPGLTVQDMRSKLRRLKGGTWSRSRYRRLYSVDARPQRWQGQREPSTRGV